MKTKVRSGKFSETVMQLTCCMILFGIAGWCQAATYYKIGQDGYNKSSFSGNVSSSVGWSSVSSTSKTTDPTIDFENSDFIIKGSAVMRTPANGGSCTFAGQSLLLRAGGTITLKNANGATITFPNLVFENGIIGHGGVEVLNTLAGAFKITPGTYACFGADDIRTLVVTATVEGDETTVIRNSLGNALFKFHNLGNFFGVFKCEDTTAVPGPSTIMLDGPFNGRLGELTSTNMNLCINYEGLPPGKGLRVEVPSEALKTNLKFFGANTDFLTDGLPILRFPAGTEINPDDFVIAVASSADDAEETVLKLRTYVDAADANAVVLAVKHAGPIIIIN